MMLAMTKKFTSEHKKRISISRKRFYNENPEARETNRLHLNKLMEQGKIGFAKGNTASVGQTPWNKGKTAKDDERIISGQTPWNYKGGAFVCIDCGKQLANRKPKNKLCSACFGKSISKENHYNWKGGITPESQAARTSQAYITWRKAVFERDDYTCQMCGSRGVEIQADHIKSFAEYPALRTTLSNGRTLCVPCHRQTPNYCRNT